uniref:CRM domain-containing protein n=1 Tax=Cajanus cajan TaxID=3821 RepID=A0A151T3P5_CAJCA|nr:hypothetical protein KK1_016154 [Cajanus cajan]
MRAERQLNIGRDGLTHNMLDNIHAHWKRRRVCKIRCKGVCTVDMDNVCHQLEERTGGKIIYRKGGVLYLFRGRNYNYKTRPHFPLMLWKPVPPVYPRLVQRVPEGLTLEEATKMRQKGSTLIPICKLGKNGVYCNLVKTVREAFEECELVRINCQGLNKSDYRKIGAKLRDLVPCTLLSFEFEHILMWRGPNWKSSVPDLGDDDFKKANKIEVDDKNYEPPLSEALEFSAPAQQKNHVEHASNLTHDTSICSSSRSDATLGDVNQPPRSAAPCMKKILLLLEQAVENGGALVLDKDSLDADNIYQNTVAFAKSAPPGPIFRKHKKVVAQKSDKQHGSTLETKETTTVYMKQKREKSTKIHRKTNFDDQLLNVVPQGTLGVDELAKLLT